MGLLRNVVNGLKAAQQPQSGALHVQPWPLPTPSYETIIQSDESRKLYIYDPRPLSHVHIGQEITVEAFRGFARLKSKLTGFQVDCGGERETALMYNGQIFGCASIPPEKVKIAAEHGYALKFRACAYGMVPQYENILDMRLYCPHMIYLYGLIPGIDDRPIHTRDDALEYFARNDMELSVLGSRDTWEFPRLRIELMPVPDGSKAKPHIAIMTDDGMMISDISVRRSKYQSLLDMMERFTEFSGKAKRFSYREDDVYYIVTIFGR